MPPIVLSEDLVASPARRFNSDPRAPPLRPGAKVTDPASPSELSPLTIEIDPVDVDDDPVDMANRPDGFEAAPGTDFKSRSPELASDM